MKDNIIFHFENLEDIDDLTLEEQGLIFRAMIAYTKTGEEPEFENPLVKAAWKPIRRRLKDDIERYENKCRKNKENGAKGGRPPKDNEENAEESENQTDNCENPKNRTVFLENPKKPKKPDSESDTESDKDTESEPPTGVSTRAKPDPQKYGEYGWVKLTQEQYARLEADLGEEELIRCIAYVDESAQSTGNKNKWRDWNLIIRKCSRDKWGYRSNDSPRRNVWEGVL